MEDPIDPVVERLRAAGCVFAEDEAAVLRASVSSAAELDALAARRCAGEPLEHVVGWAELAGERVLVDPGVFVPRRRSELLAREALARTAPGALVVDLCCGAGGLGLVLARLGPGIELHAADLDPAAVACARRNLEAPGLGRVHAGDLYDALPPELAGRVDVLVANAPYVPTAELPLLPAEARDHEPPIALDGGPDGLDLHRRIAAHAPAWLAPTGTLLIETSTHQCAATAAACEAAGLTPTIVEDDDLAATVVVATR